MLEVLLGSKNAQRILFFLLVNGKCYGTQLHRLLQSPLTPLQKALHRLEKAGILLSFYERKTKVYQFNASYPLSKELEQLLKKAYSLLPAAEKKGYYAEIGKSNAFNSQRVAEEAWNLLANVKKVSFHVKNSAVEWKGTGRGEVFVSRPKEGVLVFQEKGHWYAKPGEEVGFSNTIRWTFDRSSGLISLEHLRRGADNPVFLFYLAPSSQFSLTSVDSHCCGEDTYFGRIHFDSKHLRLSWRVIGTKKNEEIDCEYSLHKIY